jgi:DNA-binding SARP family transcriptional activator
MANQLAIRLQAHSAGLAVGEDSATTTPLVLADSTPPELELRCLGPFAVYRRGQPLSVEAFTRTKALVLLKLLALKAGAPINRDVLIEHLWPEVDPRQGINRLHGVVHDLRSVIEPRWLEREWVYVRSRGELYYLDVREAVDLDFVRFRQLIARGLRVGLARPAEATTALEQAIELYRGDLFEDDPFAEWCEGERQELRDYYVKALERLAASHREQGASEVALGYLRRALRASPYREDLLVQKIKLLMELDRSSEAAAAYESYQRLLKKDLGALPGLELQALYRRLSIFGPAGSAATPLRVAPARVGRP